MFLKTISEEIRAGSAKFYHAQRAKNGFVMSAIQCRGSRPAIISAASGNIIEEGIMRIAIAIVLGLVIGVGTIGLLTNTILP